MKINNLTKIEKNFCGWVNIITSLALVLLWVLFIYWLLPSKWKLAAPVFELRELLLNEGKMQLRMQLQHCIIIIIIITPSRTP